MGLLWAHRCPLVSPSPSPQLWWKGSVWVEKAHELQYSGETLFQCPSSNLSLAPLSGEECCNQVWGSLLLAVSGPLQDTHRSLPD